MPRTYREALGVSVAVVRRSGALRFKAACGPASAGKDPRSRIRHAAEKFDKHFREAHRLLKASKKKGDVFWIHSVQRLTFPEVQHTGLGYGAMTRSGSAVGPVLASLNLSPMHAVRTGATRDLEKFRLEARVRLPLTRQRPAILWYHGTVIRSCSLGSP